MGNWRRSALVASGFLVLFFSYGHIYQLVEDISISGFNIGRHRFLVPVFIILGLIFVWALMHKNLLRITDALNILGALVLVLPLFQIISYEIKTSTILARTPQENLLAQLSDLTVPNGKASLDI